MSLTPGVSLEFKVSVAAELEEAKNRALQCLFPGRRKEKRFWYRRSLSDEYVNMLYRWYLNGNSTRELQKLSGIDNSTIKRIFEDRGLKLRTKSEAMKISHSKRS